jgi:hypothetical protein
MKRISRAISSAELRNPKIGALLGDNADCDVPLRLGKSKLGKRERKMKRTAAEINFIGLPLTVPVHRFVHRLRVAWHF